MTAINPSAPGFRPVGQLVTGAVSRLTRSLVAVTRSTATAVKVRRQSLANSVLQVGGLACVDVGMFQVASPLGWCVTGVSAFVLAWLIQPVGDQ